jgi:GT2 family glycosyltransferase
MHDSLIRDVKKIAVLMTCHNRKNKTISCLSSLFAVTLPKLCAIDVYLVDDGSVDGTGEEVKKIFPSVNIIQGTGNLYWAGGMRLAWNVASKNSYDYYIWLNDDTFLFENSIDILLSSALKTNDNSVICSTVVSKTTGRLTYGGKMRNATKYHTPDGALSECEIISGNCVLVPMAVFNKIGSLDHHFSHAIADYDYGLRAVKAGIKCYVAPVIIGNCESNPLPPKWCLKEIPFLQRFESLYSPLGNAQPKPYFIYVFRHFGVFQAFKQFISMHVRAAFPRLWKN